MSEELESIDPSHPEIARAIGGSFAHILDQLGVSIEDLVGDSAAGEKADGDGEGDDDSAHAAGVADPFAAIVADADAPSVVDMLGQQTESNAGVASIEQGVLSTPLVPRTSPRKNHLTCRLLPPSLGSVLRPWQQLDSCRLARTVLQVVPLYFPAMCATYSHLAHSHRQARQNRERRMEEVLGLLPRSCVSPVPSSLTVLVGVCTFIRNATTPLGLYSNALFWYRAFGCHRIIAFLFRTSHCC